VRFAALRVRVGDGTTFANKRHLPGEAVWLVGEWRVNGERKYCLSNLPQRTSRRALARAVKARWVCEQAHQQLKQELGLGHSRAALSLPAVRRAIIRRLFVPLVASVRCPHCRQRSQPPLDPKVPREC
jgi:SRSO17 transposase